MKDFPVIWAQYLHFLKRARERFGWELTDDEVEKIREEIMSNSGLLAWTSKKKSMWRMIVRNKCVIVAWDKKRKVPVSIYEQEYR